MKIDGKDQTYLDIESGKYPPIEEMERKDLAKYAERLLNAITDGDYIAAISLAQTIEGLSKGMYKSYPHPLKRPFGG